MHFAPTTDGWRLALHRHRALGVPGPPVILCGGYACNRHFIDFDERHSLARYLARHGHDAWVLELRGRGLSHATPGCIEPYSWTFDDLAAVDVPSAVAYVARHTQERVAWVGHSMGGMVLYAFLGSGSPLASRVRAGITLASPVVFPRAASPLSHWIGSQILRLPSPRTIPQRWPLIGLWLLLASSPALSIGMNPENVEPEVLGTALRRSMSNVPRAKLDQLARWALQGTFRSVDERLDYRASLRRVTTPLLVVAGSADRLATPECVQAALDDLPPARTTYLELGRRYGQVADYGHVDLILGRRAPEEVFVALADWLSHAGSDMRADESIS